MTYHYPQQKGWKVKNRDLAHLCEDRIKGKIPSEIKAPLARIDQLEKLTRLKRLLL